MIAAVVNDGLLVAAFSLLGTFTLLFGGWIAREMYRTSSLLATIEERQRDHERRIEALESLRLIPEERRPR